MRIRLILGVLLTSITPWLNADVTVDGSLGSGIAGDAVTTGNGFTYDIQAMLGETQGSNLFHSFQNFDIASGEIAGFSGPAGVTNILTRITGGSPSDISGSVVSTIEGASLWLINPAGIMLGQGASVDVSGAFGLSTAHGVNLADGGIFYSNLSDTSSLGGGNPMSFEFNDNQAGVSIIQAALTQNQGSLLIHANNIILTDATLSAPEIALTTSSKSAGSVTLTESHLDVRDGGFFIQGGELFFQGSTIAGTGGDMDLQTDGTLSIKDSRLINSADGVANGHIRVEADTFILEDTTENSVLTQVATQASGTEIGGDILIDVGAISIISDRDYGDEVIESDKTTLPMLTVYPESNVLLMTQAVGESQAGDLNINAETISLDNAGIRAQSADKSFPGAINLTAQEIHLDDRAHLMSIGLDETASAKINLTAALIDLSGGSIITSASDDSTNSAITIAVTEFITSSDSEVSVSPLLTQEQIDFRCIGCPLPFEPETGISEGLFITAETMILADSVLGVQSGPLTLNATTSILMQGSSIGAGNVFAPNNAGNIIISTPTFTSTEGVKVRVNIFTGEEFFNGSSIFSSSIYSTADAGSIRITADSISLAQTTVGVDAFLAGPGQSGNIHIDTSSLEILEGVNVSAGAFSSLRDAGSITINANDMYMVGPSTSVDTQSFNSYSPGDITINANNIELDSGSSLSSVALSRQVGESIGNITLNADSISLTTDTFITTETHWDAQGGSVDITANDLLLSDGAYISAATIGGFSFVTFAPGQAPGGDVLIDANLVSITGGSSITAASFGPGDGGRLQITANQVLLSDQGILTAASVLSGRGGAISVQADDISLSSGGLITSSSAGEGDAGNIDIVATDSLTLEQSSIETRAEAAGGGNINIEVEQLIYLNQSSVSATALGDASGSDGGNVTIDPIFFIIRESAITAQALAGNGGRIDLVAQNFILDAESLIDASSEQGIDGEVAIDSPNQDVNTNVEQLDTGFADLSDLISDPCAIGKVAQSRLIVESLDSLPAAPDGFQLSGVEGDSNHLAVTQCIFGGDQ